MEEMLKELQTILLADAMVITGTVALTKYKIFSDKVGDIDLILINPPKETIDLIERMAKDFPTKRKPSPSACFVGAFKKNDLKVEVFRSGTGKGEWLEIDGLKYATIPTIVKAKKGYGRPKDFFQLRKISRLFFREEEFIAWLNKQ